MKIKIGGKNKSYLNIGMLSSKADKKQYVSLKKCIF